jgi:pyruvate,water dikinase
MVAGDTGVVLRPLPEGLSERPPLAPEEVASVFRAAKKLETAFERPQDVEWTWGRDGLVVLQSRPVTTPAGSESEDGRRWYLSLRRSFDNLESLRERIEGELIPGMIEEAERLAARAIEGLSDARLADEIERRLEIYNQWVDVYWEAFIPFAHGIRLFGQVYNDAVHPDDPYAFMDLLAGTDMASLARNETLEALASMVRQHADLRAALEEGASPAELDAIHGAFSERVRGFVDQFGDLSCPMTGSGTCDGPSDSLVSLLLEMADHEPQPHQKREQDREAMEAEYLGHFSGEERARAAELLDLARTSYRLRDDDNIHLGRIEAQVEAAVEEGRLRLSDRGRSAAEDLSRGDVARALRDPDFVPDDLGDEEPTDEMVVQARQIVGQPAGPGLAQGPARVIRSNADLTRFQHGEVLVCDAVDPNMTFVVPLASAVVERRGGMLIHGAIIAREYGLPCVTGVPDATERMRTGDSVTVDGYLGIVTIGKTGRSSDGSES